MIVSDVHCTLVVQARCELPKLINSGLTLCLSAGTSRTEDHYNLWFPETELDRQQAATAIAEWEGTEFGPLISQHGYGHGFATMREAPPVPQTQWRQTELGVPETAAEEERTARQTTAIPPAARTTATKDAIVEMYRDEGGIGPQRKIAPSGKHLPLGHPEMMVIVWPLLFAMIIA